jgi:hypothetical protein
MFFADSRIGSGIQPRRVEKTRNTVVSQRYRVAQRRQPHATRLRPAWQLAATMHGESIEVRCSCVAADGLSCDGSSCDPLPRFETTLRYYGHQA